MKILALSDIHSRFAQFAPETLPDADLCLVAGDITNFGHKRARETFADMMNAREWMRQLRRRYPVFWIPGNHDVGVIFSDFQCGDYKNDVDDFGRPAYPVRCLLDTHWVWRGGRFAGVSMSPCYDKPELATEWDYSTTRWEVEQAAYALLPKGCDVVISHCPPFGILDAAGMTRLPNGEWQKEHIGSMALRGYILAHHPRLVICGHVHGCPGEVEFYGTRVVNVAETPTVIDLAERNG